jgi:DNA-binding NarL/FixJ family response regulator
MHEGSADKRCPFNHFVLRVTMVPRLPNVSGMKRDPNLDPSIRVLLVDDDRLIRAGIRGLLSRLPGVEVAGEAGGGHEAMKLAEELHPDVVLLDIGMPGLNGLDVTAMLVKLDRSIRVVILSMHTAPEYVLRALDAGAAGYLLKESAVAELELAIRAVGRGEVYLSPGVSRTVIDGFIQRTRHADDSLSTLTPRHREVLKLVAEGRSSKEIAQRLGISHRTVETHRLQLMQRLDIHDLAGLVRFAVRVGLIDREDD